MAPWHWLLSPIAIAAAFVFAVGYAAAVVIRAALVCVLELIEWVWRRL